MAAKYKNEEFIRSVSAMTGYTYTRMSEARVAFCNYIESGVSAKRGGVTDEIESLKSYGGSPTDLRLSDQWVFNGAGTSDSDTKRWKQIKHQMMTSNYFV